MSAFQPVAPNGKDPAKKEEKSAEKQLDTLRGRLRDASQQIPMLDAAIQIVAEACQPTRTIRIEGQVCEKCDHRCQHIRYYKVTDPKQAMAAIQFVMEQVEGKPGTAEAGSQGIVVNWGIVGVNE